MGELRAFGIAVDLPRGWDGRIYRRPAADGTSASMAGLDAGEGTVNPVAHLANFPLPAERGDYGSGAVERMRAGDVLVCILEFDPEASGTELFRHEGVPTFRPGSFAPQAMQRTIQGMSGAQAFFRSAGRAFCAYAVLGSHRDRVALTPLVNRLLESVRIEDLAPRR
jgi:hypothetical protein